MAAIAAVVPALGFGAGLDYADGGGGLVLVLVLAVLLGGLLVVEMDGLDCWGMWCMRGLLVEIG